MRRYDVAVWRWWPSLFPQWCEVVEAKNAFAAVEAVMRRLRLTAVLYAAARATDGTISYRCFGVKLVPASAGSARVSAPQGEACRTTRQAASVG
jgi:hypothetical protein